MLTFLSLGVGDSALSRDEEDLDSSASVSTSTSGHSGASEGGRAGGYSQ